MRVCVSMHTHHSGSPRNPFLEPKVFVSSQSSPEMTAFLCGPYPNGEPEPSSGKVSVQELSNELKQVTGAWSVFIGRSPTPAALGDRGDLPVSSALQQVSMQRGRSQCLMRVWGQRFLLQTKRDAAPILSHRARGADSWLTFPLLKAV